MISPVTSKELLSQILQLSRSRQLWQFLPLLAHPAQYCPPRQTTEIQQLGPVVHAIPLWRQEKCFSRAWALNASKASLEMVKLTILRVVAGSNLKFMNVQVGGTSERPRR